MSRSPALDVPEGINPRYAAYARAHGKNPAAMMRQDRRKLHPSAFLDSHTIADRAAFTDFLLEHK